MKNKTIKIGTRKSKLALYQANFVSKLLNGAGYKTELIHITTTGDRFLKDSLSKIGGKGLFIKEIEEKLLNKDVDLAVHSLKDVPSEQNSELMLSAYIKRDDPRDCWISSFSIKDISRKKIVVGTTSLRRQLQLKNINKKIDTKVLRGNVDTRLRKLDNGEYDAIVLSYSGLLRLGIDREDMFPLPADEMVPSAGQGVIVVQTRRDNEDLNDIVKKFNHRTTQECVCLERGLQKFIGGDCFVPFGAFFEKIGSEVIGRLFFYPESKPKSLKIIRRTAWKNRKNLSAEIKDEIKKYLL